MIISEKDCPTCIHKSVCKDSERFTSGKTEMFNIFKNKKIDCAIMTIGCANHHIHVAQRGYTPESRD